MTRPKSFLRLFFGPSGWGAAFAAFFIFSGLFVMSNTADKAARLTTEGATQMARVTDLRAERPRPGLRWGSLRLSVSYEFTVGTRSYFSTQEVSRAFFRSVSIGDQMPVLYWTQDPVVSEIEIGKVASDHRAGLIVTLLAILATGVLGWRAGRNAAEAAWMARHGQRQDVWITDHVAAGARIGLLPNWRATWHGPDGAPGASAYHVKSALPPIGQRVTILVDPDGRRPGRLESDVCRAPHRAPR
jgi:hypothetical protein